MRLESYVQGSWTSGRGAGVALRDASTGEVVAHADSGGIDFGVTLAYGRRVGGAALRGLSFHQRAAMLKSLGKHLMGLKEEFYELSYRTGATRSDSWVDIEGGIGTMLAYAARGSRELPNSTVLLDGDVEGLSKGGTFVGQHICTSLEGVALQINAFNFPVWGMLAKLAPAFLAGVPAVVKPATATAYLTERVVRRIIEAQLLPEGSLQLICGGVGGLFDHLTCQDVVSFTGSADTAQALRTHVTVARHSVRMICETDSLNSSILGADAVAGSAEFDLYIREVAREMTVKAGQKCTAIRKIIVPADRLDDVASALRLTLSKVVVGDPRTEGVRMGPVASLAQRREVLARVAELRDEADLILGDPETLTLASGDRERGAFLPPMLLRARDGVASRAIHEIEAFGPVATLVPYRTEDEAIAIARRGGGSLAASVFTADDSIARALVLGLAPFHGRILVINRHSAKESTGHGSPLAPLVHGGPGRAGGGEELGGVRGVMHYMQRSAIQGSPETLSVIGGRWIRGAQQRDPGVHPFRKPFHDLVLGDTFTSGEREVTIEDIERFAALTGDTYYAHMDEAQAARNPLFGGRVAHGYFLISAAAGLFVDPAYGPVLGNYGLDSLRFVKPVKSGDRIKVRLTCKSKSLRADKGWGEVAWDTEITNQAGETVASYSVLTMVSERAVPDAPPEG